MELDEFVETLKKVPRCVFVVGNSNPTLRFPHSPYPMTLHPKYIVSYGPKRFSWMFQDPDEGIDYKGTVRWKNAVFMGVHAPLIQYAFPYSIDLPFVYDADDGMERFLKRTAIEVIEAGIGPIFIHNTLVRKGALQVPDRKKDRQKEVDKISFRDELSAIVATGLLHPSVRLQG